MTKARALGGCLCGAVRFSTPGPILFCCHCHCAWCRRAHGAAFVTWFGVPDDTFELIAEDGALTFFKSSEKSERGFCSRCGTTLFFRSSASPGEMHVALACADGDIGRVPSLHIFYDARVPWITLGDDLPKHDGLSPGLARYKDIPKAPPSARA